MVEISQLNAWERGYVIYIALSISLIPIPMYSITLYSDVLSTTWKGAGSISPFLQSMVWDSSSSLNSSRA